MARWAESTIQLIMVTGWRAMVTIWISITISPTVKWPSRVRVNRMR